MNYTLLKDIIDLLVAFEKEAPVHKYPADITGFKQWVAETTPRHDDISDASWEGRESGRTTDSVINTLFVQLNRYARSYSRSAIHGSDFSTQDDFIYLITLKSSGPMTKMELIKKNVQDKAAGMKVIDRLLKLHWVEQHDSNTDKRSKVLTITDKGLISLENQMKDIRRASKIVTGNLTSSEKMQLISLLQKLDDFHRPIYEQNINPAQLLDRVEEFTNQS